MAAEASEIFKCRRCGAMFDNKVQAEAHAKEEFNKVFPETTTTSIKTREPEVTRIRDWLDAYNTVGSAIRRNFDFDAAMENVWNMDAASDLFGSRRKKVEWNEKNMMQRR